MSIKTGWDTKDSTIIRCVIQGNWTWEEFHDAAKEIQRLSTKVSFRVDMMIDLAEAGPLPMASASLHIKGMLDRMPEHFGVVILVSPENYTRMVFENLDRSLPEAKDRFFIMESARSARQAIYQQRNASIIDPLDAQTRPIMPIFPWEDSDDEDSMEV